MLPPSETDRPFVSFDAVLSPLSSFMSNTLNYIASVSQSVAKFIPFWRHALNTLSLVLDERGVKTVHVPHLRYGDLIFHT